MTTASRDVSWLAAADPEPAPRWRAAVALVGHELRLALRRGESLLATIILPAAVLAFFGSVAVFPTGTDRPVAFVLPGTLALAIVATSLVSLGITTGYERAYGVLKRLGGTPVTTGTLVVAKTIGVLVVEIAQAVLLVAIATAFLGWRPAAGVQPIVLIGAFVLGTATFAGLGLLLAGTLRAEANLAFANGLFLAALLLGGLIVPLDRLPAGLAEIARLLPVTALGDAIRIGLGASAADPLRPLALLLAWAGVTGFGTVATFRWD